MSRSVPSQAGSHPAVRAAESQLDAAVRRAQLRVPREERTAHVHQEQSARRCGDADPGRRRRCGGRARAGTASAATPSCGNSCIDIFSHQFGTHSQPNYVVDVLRQGEKVGQPIILFRTANFDPAEDWTLAFQGTAADFFAAGLVSSAVALHYGCIPAGQLPGLLRTEHGRRERRGVRDRVRALRRGLAVCAWAWPPRPSRVRALRCSRVACRPRPSGSRTSSTRSTPRSPGYVPAINGSDTNFSQPFVLTYPSSGVPTDKPRPQLEVTNITGFSNASPPFFIPGPELGTVDVNQLWGADFGILK